MRKVIYIIIFIFCTSQYGFSEIRIKKIYVKTTINKDAFYSDFNKIYYILYDTNKNKKNQLLMSKRFKIEILNISKEWILVKFKYQGKDLDMYFTINLFNIPSNKYINIFDKYINPQETIFSQDKKGEFIAFQDYSVSNFIESKNIIINGKNYNKKIYFKDLNKILTSFNEINKEINEKYF